MSYEWDIEDPKGYNNKMGNYRTKSEFDFIKKYLRKRMKILDIGGGSGRFAIPLKEKGHDVTVIDKNREAIDILTKRCSEIKYIINEFNYVEIDEEFDLIISIEVLLYIKDWSNIFKKVYSLLSNNGVFIFTATNKFSWRTILREIGSSKKDLDYIMMSISKYSEIIHQNGFRIDCIEGFYWIPLKVDSNSKFVDIFSYIEKKIRLKYWIAQSPWLLVAVNKNS